MKNSLGQRIKIEMGLETDEERKKRVAQEKKDYTPIKEYFDRILSQPEPIKYHHIPTEQFKTLFWKHGKTYFRKLNRKFIVDEHNKEFLDLICRYFANDEEFEKRTDGELRKGLFIYGPCGTGKSSVFDIVRNISKHYNLIQFWFSNVSVHQVITEFNLEGESVVEKYSRGMVHFDDLGTEKMVQAWGVKEHLFERLLQIRYNNFKEKGTKTFVTTNLSIQSLRKIYGKQVYDRIFEMFNFIELGGKTRRF